MLMKLSGEPWTHCLFPFCIILLGKALGSWGVHHCYNLFLLTVELSQVIQPLAALVSSSLQWEEDLPYRVTQMEKAGHVEMEFSRVLGSQTAFK